MHLSMKTAMKLREKKDKKNNRYSKYYKKMD